MRDKVMADIKLVQVFLSQAPSPEPGIYEVSLVNDTDFICNCPGYTGKNTCVHVKTVKRKVKENNGVYPLEISRRCPEGEAEKAESSPEAFRAFVIKYGKIETC
jgi:hypothetical protein